MKDSITFELDYALLDTGLQIGTIYRNGERPNEIIAEEAVPEMV